MKLTASTAANYAAMLSKLLPRGPIWDGAQAALGALLTALGAELNEVHARLVQVMEEAFPGTADETLADWLRVWALPGPCSTMPTTDAGKRELLAGKVAAQGGQSRAYYIGIVRAILGDLDAAVTITERPYGNVFRAWSGRAWDSVGGRGLAHYWRVTLPSGTTPSQVDAVDCVLQAYKPAHTVLEVIGLVSAYYESPGGAGDFLEASTSLAAREIFPASGTPIDWSIGFWLEREAGTADELCLFSVSDEADPGYESALQALVFDPVVSDGISINLDGVPGSVSLGISPYPDTSTWTRFGFTFDATLGELRVFVDGVEVAADADPSFAWVPGSIFRLLGLFAGGQELDGRIRNILINNRAHSADEEAALYAAGKSHDLRAPYGDDWAGETPPIYWCRAAVAALMWTYYTENQGLVLVENPTASGDATIIFWLSAEAADEGEHVINGPFELILSASVPGFVVSMGATTTTTVYAFNTLHMFAVVANGTDHRLYVDGVLEATAVTAASLVGDLELLAIGLDGNRYTAGNVAICARDLAAAEIGDLYTAGSTHDLRRDAGDDWAGEVPLGYWRDEPGVGSAVASIGSNTALTLTLDADCAAVAVETEYLRVINSGSAGTCDLLLYGDTTSEED